MAAALVGGAFLSATLQVLFERLASRELLNLVRDPKRDDGEKLLQKLKLTLLSLKPVLDDAERKQITDPSVKDWLDELKDAVYHADDLLDQIAYQALRLKAESEYKSGSNQVQVPITTCASLFDPEIVSKIEEIVCRLEYFAKAKDVLGLKEVSARKWSEKLPSTSLVDESGVFGRGKEKEEIIRLLVSDEAGGSGIDVIPIVGLGGLGKTTLAQLVYNDSRVVGHFEKQAWVCVSEDFDVFRVTKTILEAVTPGNSDFQDLNLLQVRLKESLMGKKFLIVLDDVWDANPSHWDILMAPFKSGACGSKIIVTTRNCNVAAVMQTIPVHHLRQLSDEDCWSLFAKIAFNKGDSTAHPYHEMIGKEIVLKKCKGLPLAVKTLAGLLRSTLDVEEWDGILKSDIWDLPEEKNDILPALKLSYHYLPPHLKQCFAYCSLFPKDYAFEKEKLVLLWIAQNFVRQPKSNKSLGKVADEYFNELLSRSFFQQSSGNGSSFVMHDLVHDLAQVVSGQFSIRLDDMKLQSISAKVRHFSYVKSEYATRRKFQVIKEARWLRTLLPLKANYYYLSKRVLDDMLPTLQCSRVLSLPHYRIMELPTSIGNLIQLRYLDLSGTEIKQLPDTVCTLYNLQTLLLSKCGYLTSLPAEMGKLICLRHLDVSGTNLREMPMQMSQLKGLERLTNFVVGKCSGSGINELKEFYQLRGKLCVSNLQNVMSGRDALEARLHKKQQLEELVLQWDSSTDDSQNEREVLENLQPHKNLKHLTIKSYGGTRFPNWVGEALYSELVSLSLEECDYCYSLPPLGQLPFLKDLKIARMKGIIKVGQEFYGDVSLTKPFQSLETLHFEEMSEWVEWSTSGTAEFSLLREMCIIKCPKLVGGLPKHIPSWVRLEIQDCSGLLASVPRTSAAGILVLKGCDGLDLGWQGLSCLVDLHISHMPSLKELTPELCALANLKKFEIEKCPNLLSFPDTGLPPMLTRLSISDCEAIQFFLAGMMRINTCLQDLRISGCSSLVSFAADGLPPTLKYLSIMDCPNLVVPLSEEMEQCYTSLESLTLKKCDCLTHLPLEFFPKLRFLNISYCKNFETLSNPNEHGLQNMTSSLESVVINSCDSMVSFPQGGLPVSNLSQFQLWRCGKLKALPERMHSLLPSLQSLMLYYCPEIESFPEGGLPSNLRELEISHCKKLVARRREWGLQRLPSLTRFTLGGEYEKDVVESFPEEGMLPSTLKSLWIRDQPNLKSLNHRGFQLLCFLEYLIIWDCPLLQSLSEEGLPALLKELSIRSCPQLQSLPKKGLPASLSELKISDCPLLKLRCQRDRGDDWHKISHIAFIEIDREIIS